MFNEMKSLLALFLLLMSTSIAQAQWNVQLVFHGTHNVLTSLMPPAENQKDCCNKASTIPLFKSEKRFSTRRYCDQVSPLYIRLFSKDRMIEGRSLEEKIFSSHSFYFSSGLEEVEIERQHLFSR